MGCNKYNFFKISKVHDKRQRKSQYKNQILSSFFLETFYNVLNIYVKNNSKYIYIN